ncbi:CAAX protease [Campylobacter sp. FMV-PI01]|uniref:CAAX protease n=1 Tax=Campylobacter portucalensis TaxID=2608384 RepID=A0A6L5WHA7_9BACT|nr:Abi family protein [Campylobacter portucalensis]MSN96570.1 CAAX protease [Campylobacter portucalensis]
MYLKNHTYQKIYENLGFDESFGIKGFDKLKNSISLLHNGYLLGSCKEAGIFIKNHKDKKIENIFDFVISIYNKRIKTHHILFLFIHIFETALRSKMAIVLSNNYSSDKNSNDDWFKNPNNPWLVNKTQRVINMQRSNLDLNSTTSYEVLDLFTFGDLENVIKNHWADFKPIFADTKKYKNQDLPCYGTKEHFLNTLSRIRKARNDIFHNRPSRIKPKSIIANIEILLLRLDFNLKDAFYGIENSKYNLNLKYSYD